MCTTLFLSDGTQLMTWTWKLTVKSCLQSTSLSRLATTLITSRLLSSLDSLLKCLVGKLFTPKSSYPIYIHYLNRSSPDPPASIITAIFYRPSVSKSVETIPSRKACKKTCMWLVCQTHPTTVSLQTFSSLHQTTNIHNYQSSTFQSLSSLSPRVHPKQPV